MADPELLPCPFCGGEPERIDFGPGDAENEGGSCIACKQCQSSGPVEFGRKENFISNWNRRAALSQQRAVAEEWRWVPVAATAEMWEAGMNCWSPDDTQGDYLEKAWEAMLAAAPSPEDSNT